MQETFKLKKEHNENELQHNMNHVILDPQQQMLKQEKHDLDYNFEFLM